MTLTDRQTIVVCNGAREPGQSPASTHSTLRLEYRSTARHEQNVTLELPAFVQGVLHLPNRILDLLELAAYLYAADRSTDRGRKDAVEYHRWSRSFSIITRVRDSQFWKEDKVRQKLASTLQFMTGDRSFDFTFTGGHRTPPSSLFDRRAIHPSLPTRPKVVLFSGGIDSLAGVVELLETTDSHLCLVSHQSQSGSIRTQNSLVAALTRSYPGRLSHYRFRCTLHGARATEETQRTRSFLYLSIAFAIARAFKLQKCFVFENGITALNIPKRQELINARASRTVHPKTIRLLEDLFTTVAGRRFVIETPFFLKTKTDVLAVLKEYKQTDLISSAVSCSKTFQNLEAASHCGGCSQCIDRRFAAYAAGLGDLDSGSGLYAFDFNREQIVDPEARTTLIDFIRQAREFSRWSIDHFHDQLLSDLAQICDGSTDTVSVEQVWKLCRSHGANVGKAIRLMREEHDDPFTKPTSGSFIELVSDREYLKEPVERLVRTICARLARSIPTAFQRHRPNSENEVNDQVQAILNDDAIKYEREFPVVRFALARAIPDHSVSGHDLFIETKYPRGSTTPSKISEGMAADLTKYPPGCHILFLVYDPERRITDDVIFSKGFEARGRCTVSIIR